MNDLKLAFRQLTKHPGLTAVGVISLSLGIAANTVIFSVVNTLLLRPAPVEAPEQLWQVWQQNLKAGTAWQRYYGLSYPGYAYFRDQNRSFVSLAAFDPEPPSSAGTATGSANPSNASSCRAISSAFVGSR